MRFEIRWVWPTIIASTVVSWSASAMPGWADPRHARGVADRGSRRRRALVDDDDLDLDALPPQSSTRP